jgi:hypothetical protein
MHTPTILLLLAPLLPLIAATTTNHCNATAYGVGNSWTVTVVKDTQYNKQCGGGCLDNLRGRCGAITMWGCSRNSDGGARYEFDTTDFCSDYDVTQAMLACTKKEQNIPCSMEASKATN